MRSSFNLTPQFLCSTIRGTLKQIERKSSVDSPDFSVDPPPFLRLCFQGNRFPTRLAAPTRQRLFFIPRCAAAAIYDKDGVR
jgi:hypothetical protein